MSPLFAIGHPKVTVGWVERMNPSVFRVLLGCPWLDPTYETTRLLSIQYLQGVMIGIEFLSVIAAMEMVAIATPGIEIPFRPLICHRSLRFLRNPPVEILPQSDNQKNQPCPAYIVGELGQPLIDLPIQKPHYATWTLGR
jgi:hypothetical protein